MHKERPRFPEEIIAGVGVKILCGREGDIYKSKEKRNT